MERDRNWAAEPECFSSFCFCLKDETGQSTVEFAVITAGFLAMVVALGAMWHAFGGGLLVEHALAVASHHIQAVAPVTIVDIFLY